MNTIKINKKTFKNIAKDIKLLLMSLTAIMLMIILTSVILDVISNIFKLLWTL